MFSFTLKYVTVQSENIFFFGTPNSEADAKLFSNYCWSNTIFSIELFLIERIITGHHNNHSDSWYWNSLLPDVLFFANVSNIFTLSVWHVFTDYIFTQSFLLFFIIDTYHSIMGVLITPIL